VDGDIIIESMQLRPPSWWTVSNPAVRLRTNVENSVCIGSSYDPAVLVWVGSGPKRRR